MYFLRVYAQIDKTTPTRNIANTLRVILNVDLENSLFKRLIKRLI